MSAPQYTKRDATLAFIEAYRGLPELWGTENRHYSNRAKKSAAYDLLVEKLKLLEPDATRDSVVKKINSLRSAFRKEVKKVEESRRSGTSPDNLYVPSLWYYQDLLFLVDQETPDNSLSTVGGSAVGENAEGTGNALDILENSMPTVLSEQEPSSRPPSKKMKTSVGASAEKLLSVAKTYLEKEDDESLIMAKAYAMKMKKLSPEQRMFADRVITETLLDGQMGRLTRWTSLNHNRSATSHSGTPNNSSPNNASSSA